MDLEVY